MSARSLSVNLKPDALVRYETGPLVFQTMAPPALLATRSRSGSGAGSLYWKPPSQTVWNCDLYDRFV
jgi:hypothetical protein